MFCKSIHYLLLVALLSVPHINAGSAFMQHARTFNRFGLQSVYALIKPILSYAQSALLDVAPAALYEWVNEDPYEQVDAQVRFTLGSVNKI